MSHPANWTVRKEPLIEAVRILDNIQMHNGVASSMYIQIVKKSQGEIQMRLASEMKGEYRVKGEGTWPFEKPYYIDRRTFGPFVAAADGIKSDAEFEFTRIGKVLRISQGRRSSSFTGQPPLKGYGFDEDEIGKTIKARLVLTRKARALIHCGVGYSTDDPITPHLNCVYVRPTSKHVDIYSTNRKLIYHARALEKVDNAIPIPLPIKLVDLLEHKDLKEVQWRQKAVSLIFRRGQIWQPVSARARTHFPAKEIDMYLEVGVQLKTTFSCLARRFAVPLQRLAGYTQAITRQDWLLTVVGKKGMSTVTLISSIPQTKFRERVTTTEPLKEDFTLQWPLDKVMPVFQFLAERDNGTIRVRVDRSHRSYVSGSNLHLIIPGVKQ